MTQELTAFHDDVVLKYHLYNSLFLTLPFGDTEKTGTLLSVFAKYCQTEIRKGKSPAEIIDHFFTKNATAKNDHDKINSLFKMLQFVERQIVLFDALEDAAFSTTHDLSGTGSLTHFITKVENREQQSRLMQQLLHYQTKIVLTAHPTQFYPAPILGIMTQLVAALRDNELKQISLLLLQMGKTSFKHQQKPTPYEEAHSLIWYLENTFYPILPALQSRLDELRNQHGIGNKKLPNCLSIGFWPGGDRDGNPHVTADTTLAVAKLLKTRVLRMYMQDLRRLVKQLTFQGVLQKLEAIRVKLENTHLAAQIEHPNTSTSAIYHSADDFLQELMQLRQLLIRQHSSLFLDNLDAFITKVRCFNFYFASMDMRENAQIHRIVFATVISDLAKQAKFAYLRQYESSSDIEKIAILQKIMLKPVIYSTKKSTNPQVSNCLTSIAAIKTVQRQNGEASLCRYIISNTESALDVLELLALLHVDGSSEPIPVDIIPLFESIQDLENCSNTMQQLYECEFYQRHLQQRGKAQTIMLGFSDGTKDGGYVAANWSIYKAKMALTALSKRYDISVIFFDGRGGPPGRGGGNTHAFYRSLGSKISHEQLQLTVQGQTISASFGTTASAQYNVEQLFTAGLEDLVFPETNNDLTDTEVTLLEQLSQASRKAYLSLKSNPLFVPYLEQMTPLQFYSELNVGSRPSSRSKQKQLRFSQLRAIPFVGSWSQLKQNVPGYYGFGSALQQLILAGKKLQLIHLYQHSLFFRTLVENAMMSLSKSFFPLTAYMKKDPHFGKFWQQLAAEAELTKKLLLEISGQPQLLANDPLNRESIQLREEIVLPLLIIQQFAMIKLNQLDKKDTKLYTTYKNLILKALAANTNASRNSA